MKSHNKQLDILKIFIVFIFGLPLILNGITFNVAYAQAPKVPTCAELENSTKMSGWIMTVVEESISTPANTDNQPNNTQTNVLDCFRQSKLDTASQKWTPSYVIKCETPTPTLTCQRVQVFLAQSGADLLYTYVGQIYKWAAGSIGIVAVLFLVWGGIEISTAQGDSGKIEKAKERILQSLGGLVLLFLSALILYTINPNFFIL